MAGKSELLHLPNKGRSSIVSSETLSSLVARARKDVASLSQQASKEVGPSDANAQFEIGLKYYRGDGAPYDTVLAAYWFSKAADQDHTGAQRLLGLLHNNEGAYVSAINFFRKAADKGHAQAQFWLGLQYFWGHGVEPDKVLAAYWCRKAADLGDLDAQSRMGWLYEGGNGISKDGQQSVYWYLKAADQGDLDMQRDIGLRYYGGAVVEQDHVEALYWLSIYCRRVRSYENIAGDRCSAAAKQLTPSQLLDVQNRVDQWIAAHPARVRRYEWLEPD